MSSSVPITRVLADAMRELRPGEVQKIVLDDGQEFAMMPWDDYEHIAQLADLTHKPAES